jgi:hypothetical protein
MSRDVSNHHPYVISMTTDIPKSRVSHFENFWLPHDDFMPVMIHGWNVHVGVQDKAKRLMAKFNNLCRVLRSWYGNISNLATNISNDKLLIGFLINLRRFVISPLKNGILETLCRTT